MYNVTLSAKMEGPEELNCRLCTHECWPRNHCAVSASEQSQHVKNLNARVSELGRPGPPGINGSPGFPGVKGEKGERGID
ncbi:hypothetical protein OSTOST_12764, partial [Ostertagia ostertagi]